MRVEIVPIAPPVPPEREVVVVFTVQEFRDLQVICNEYRKVVGGFGRPDSSYDKETNDQQRLLDSILHAPRPFPTAGGV